MNQRESVQYSCRQILLNCGKIHVVHEPFLNCTLLARDFRTPFPQWIFFVLFILIILTLLTFVCSRMDYKLLILVFAFAGLSLGVDLQVPCPTLNPHCASPSPSGTPTAS